MTLLGIELGLLEVKGEWSDHNTTEAPSVSKKCPISIMSIGHTQMSNGSLDEKKRPLDIKMSICPLDEQKCPMDIQMSIRPLDEQKCPVDIQMSIGHIAEVLDMYDQSYVHCLVPRITHDLL